MKIEFLEKTFLPFEDLRMGDVFCYKGNVYMKTDAPADFSAVNLYDGRTEFFKSNSMVKKFDNAKVCLS